MFIFPTRGIDDGHHSIWFWSVRNLLGVCCKANTIPQRANLPRSIREATSTSSIDLSDWGTPSASYPAPVCDVPRFFTAQQLVFDITLCGIWFGAFLTPRCLAFTRHCFPGPAFHLSMIHSASIQAREADAWVPCWDVTVNLLTMICVAV